MKPVHLTLIGAAVIVILTFAVYQPAINGGFIWDDDLHVSDNIHLRSNEGLRRIWFEIGSLPQYYPMTFSSFWINYQIGGLDTTGYHVVNIILHTMNALLIWLILSRLGVTGAWAVALVFALHPVHVESAAWISERKNVLSGFFYLVSFFAFIRFYGLDGLRSPPKKKARMIYALSLVFYVFALLSKTVTASLPAALLLVIWWKRSKIILRDVRVLAPFFVAGIAAGLLTVYMEIHFVGAEGEHWDYTFIGRILIAGRALWFYFIKLLIPYKLIFNYPRWKIDAGTWWQYLFPLAVIAVIAILWLKRKQIARGPLTAVLFFCGTLVPALGFFDVYPFKYSFVADHFQYLASIGAITLVVSGAAELLNRYEVTGRNMIAAAMVVVGVLGFQSWRQAHVYENIEVLWNDTIAKNPDSWMAYNNLGILLNERGDVDKAIEILETAIKVNPVHAKAHFNLGDALMNKGMVNEAIKHYKESIRLWPEDVSSYLNLGNALKKQGKYDEAMAEYRKAIEINPNYADAWYNLGLAQMEQGDNESAVENFRKAVSVNPYFAEAYNNMGSALFQLGRVAEAAESFGKTLSIDPNHAGAHYNLGYIQSRQGRLEEAVRNYQASLRANPNFASAHYNLGLVLEMLGRNEEARRHFNEAARLRK